MGRRKEKAFKRGVQCEGGSKGLYLPMYFSVSAKRESLGEDSRHRNWDPNMDSYSCPMSPDMSCISERLLVRI